MEVTYIKIFVDYLDAIELLSDTERGRLFTALMQYARSGEAPQLSGNERFVFPMMRAQIDRDTAAMGDTAKSKAKAGRASAEVSECAGTQKREYSSEFRAFWEFYPCKTDKAMAYKMYCARLKDGYTPDELLTAARLLNPSLPFTGIKVEVEEV